MASESVRSMSRGFPSGGWQLDSVVTGLSILMMTGIALDARSHAAGTLSFAEEGFLTPEHVFFYSAFLGIAAVIGGATVLNRRAGADWVEAVPDGYGIGVLGVLVFGFGGLGDYMWHSSFGFEQGVEALTSPTHQLLAVGGILFLTSPLRATWRREGSASPGELLSTLLSGMLSFSLFGLFASLVNPVASPAVFSTVSRELGVAGFMVFPAVLVAVGILLSRRFDLLPGSLTLVFLGPAVMGVAVRPGFYQLAGAIVAAGIVADLLIQLLPPRPGRVLSLRLFGLAVPLAFGATYMAIAMVAFEYPIVWSVHIWTGAVTFGALGGLVVTYISVPDATREVRG